MINNRLFYLLGFIFCVALNINAAERNDSTVCSEEHVPNEVLENMHSLLADVPSDDPKVQSDSKIPKWVAERISAGQAKLIKKYMAGKEHTDYLALLSVLADSALTNQYFVRFKSQTTDSAIKARDHSFALMMKDLPPQVLYVSLPYMVLNRPVTNSVDNCQLCSYQIYSPINGDDIHVVLDVLFKKGQGDSYKIVGQYVRLIGKLSKTAVFASETKEPVVVIQRKPENGQGIFRGCIDGDLSYFKDGNPKQVLVNSWFSISPK